MHDKPIYTRTQKHSFCIRSIWQAGSRSLKLEKRIFCLISLEMPRVSWVGMDELSRRPISRHIWKEIQFFFSFFFPKKYKAFLDIQFLVY